MNFFETLLGGVGQLMSLGSLVTNLYANKERQKLFRQQSGYYEWEAKINRDIGALNAQAAVYAGEQAVGIIAAQTKQILSKQLVEFSNRGIELDGSPLFVMGETVTMGSRMAQNAYFNAQVEKFNYLYRAEAAAVAAKNRADESQYGSYSAQIDSMKGIKQGFDLVKSMFRSSPLNSESMSSSNSPLNYFANSQVQRSPIDSIIMSRMRLK